MEVNKKQLSDIFGVSVRTIQNWQDQGMPVVRGGGKGNEVLYDSATAIKWFAERDADIENEKLRKEVEELRKAGESDLQPGTIDYERYAVPGVRVEGTSPSFFVKSTDASELQRLDTLTINGISYWIDRIGPDDCGSCHLWLGNGQPPAGNRRR